MARPVKKGLQYFPMDVDFFNDDKVIELMEQYGGNGAMVYQAALCMVYRAGYCLETTMERMALCITRMIGNRWLNREEAAEILTFCGELGLFDKALMGEGVFTSRAIQERYAATKKEVKNPVHWLLEDKGRVNSEKPGVISEKPGVIPEKPPIIPSEIPQSKVNKNKEKEIETKANENKEREKGAGSAAPSHTDAHAFLSFGENGNVFLTQLQYQMLKGKVREPDKLIDSLSNYMASTGKTYHDHYATLLRWDALDRERPRLPGRRENLHTSPPSYDIEAFERDGFDLPEFPFAPE